MVEFSDSDGDVPCPAAASLGQEPGGLQDRPCQHNCRSLQAGTWNELTTEGPTSLLQFLRGIQGTVSFLATLDGRTVAPVSSILGKGQKVWIWVPGFGPEPTSLNPARVLLCHVEEVWAPVLPAAARKEVLPGQGIYLADDQVASSLKHIAGTCSDVCVVDPLLLIKCVQDDDPDPLRHLGAALSRQVRVISAVPFQGHWVAFAWDLHCLKFHAWDSCPVGHLDVEVSAVHRVWAKVLGFTCNSFAFRQAPARPHVPGLCGHFALADLWRYLRNLDHPTHDGALALAATFAAAFELSLHSDHLVRVPLFFGGGAGDLVGMGLASLLREKGVPSGRALERANQAVDRLGAHAIQDAMTSRNPWKAVKQLGNNCTPAFQFVLQDELEKSIQSRAAGPDPAPKKKKAPKSRQEVTTAQAPRLPQIEDLVIPEGVFASEEPLCRIDLQTMGAHSVGVVLVTPTEPYLRLGQPVSQVPSVGLGHPGPDWQPVGRTFCPQNYSS